MQSAPEWLLTLLLFLMLRNRAYRVCPCFFSYVAFGVAAGVARFATYNHPGLYFATYWTTEAGYCILGILAMHEVFRAAVRARIWWSYVIFPSIVIVGVGLSLARAHAAPPQFSGLRYYIVVGEIAVRFVQVIMFVGMGVHAAVFGSRWRPYFLGIAAGFGFFAAVALPMTMKFSDLGTRFRFFWGRILIAAYSVAVLIWIWFFRAPQPEESPLGPELPLDANPLNQYRDRPKQAAPVAGLPTAA